jgi:hypothetical protein
MAIKHIIIIVGLNKNLKIKRWKPRNANIAIDFSCYGTHSRDFSAQTCNKTQKKK